MGEAPRELPGLARAAAIIWIVVGFIGIGIVAILTLAATESDPSERIALFAVLGLCGALYLAFVVEGFFALAARRPSLVGNGVGSLVLGVLSLPAYREESTAIAPALLLILSGIFALVASTDYAVYARLAAERRREQAGTAGQPALSGTTWAALLIVAVLGGATAVVYAVKRTGNEPAPTKAPAPSPAAPAAAQPTIRDPLPYPLVTTRPAAAPAPVPEQKPPPKKRRKSVKAASGYDPCCKHCPGKTKPCAGECIVKGLTCLVGPGCACP
jgi:hypothetical protein